ncbi:hypothetical protein A3C37_03025 [Candidatus Peribacteria bacterium RIFCSPHIGHO2_02_FULL_53_20]|nr:MAG: hypothetical protein A3C37_03025 [Candidatus Peribacteria bacterium RIFCSPHIGHO2_02_FULL_53_20]OGJ67013.1 MAG: hypothetical protein A3B61_05485 [Candidatus Peribacteria bacterium RIFCSPLOWO2_01_FULL_53_10]OGJ72879.1 MAG: hypothetical protein A3G69_04755 [Candidatus Peribacteria bacterium RIFCSPLOWO2_12_FULL_53_10]
MKEIDVPEYYGYAAAHFEYVFNLATRLADVFGVPEEMGECYRGIDWTSSKLAIQQRLSDPMYHDALAVVSAARGLQKGEYFSDVVLELQNRHKVRSRLGALFNASQLLRKNSELRQEINQLLDKFKESYQVRLLP